MGTLGSAVGYKKEKKLRVNSLYPACFLLFPPCRGLKPPAPPRAGDQNHRKRKKKRRLKSTVAARHHPAGASVSGFEPV
uniref:Uncharacterized protein n=1 Tax=Oryza punctata TaxID=4537 RepID=A0A0E0LI56_ORYPU